ncbi:MAG TPA: hypothetical protein VIK18_20465 [Pirellulales bacterium]
MRLTLRNMLNYMDDVLEPADSQDISKQIEESEFATGLMHRIRDVSRRLRMAAPKVDGRGIGLDPNTVAEYLDNTLASERVPDFEKVCLESDMHLAEVASCHQVLALVLGEPADVDPAIRQRMYQIGSQHRQPASSAAAGSAAASSAAAGSAAFGSATVAAASPYSIVTQPIVETVDQRPARKKPEVPDYLREPTRGRSRGRAIAAAAVLAILAGGVYAGYQSGRLDSWLAPPEVADNSDAQPAQPPTGAPASPPSGINLTSGDANQPATGQPPASGGARSPAAGQPAGGQPAGAQQAGAQPASNQVATSQPQASSSMPAPATANPATTVPAPGTAAPASNPAAGGAASVPAPASTTTGLNQPSSQPAMTPDQPAASASPAAPNAPEPPKPATAVAPGGAPKPAPAELGNAAAAVPVVLEGLGRLISEREVLLRFDRQTQAWVRLTSRGTVYPGDRLLSLPTYRSTLTLTAGVSLQLLGGTLVELLPPDARGVPGVRLLDGRAILLTFGKPGAQIKLWSGIRQGSVTFADPDSTLAVEVVRTRIDGSNPEKEPATIAVNLYSTAGSTSWSDEMHVQPLPLQSPSRMSFAAAIESPSAEPATPDDFPAWIKTDERPAMEKRASTAVEETLEADRPISLGLKELAGDRRSEVSSLAVQCLAEIDEFESVVIALSDPGQRGAWNTLVESLRTAIARSPATAEKVRQAFEHHRGPEGDELYRMLWGYSPDQLQTGAAAQLVKYLDHDDLDFRELAFWNLTRIGGSSGHYYRPTDTAAKRLPALRAWKQKLDAGALYGKALEK